MSTVDAITAASLQTGSTVAPAARKTTLDSEVFLKLLVTQLSNQDPSSPMDTNEMIAQTTQLASMEQLTALATTSSESFALSMRATAAAFIGQQASYIDAEGATRTGVVSSVSFTTGVPVLQIGDAAVRLDEVSGLTSVS